MYEKPICLTFLLVAGLTVNIASADITSDLVAWWALDDGSGTVAKDSAGHPSGPHDGALQNGPQWENSDVMVGVGALKFDGIDDRIVVESFDVQGSGITIAAWIKPPDLSAMNDPRMVSKAQGGGTADHYWAMVLSGSGENNLEFRLRTDSGAATRRTSPEGNDMLPDEWAHIAVTWDADDPVMRLYKNGEEIDSVDKAGTAVGVEPGVRIGVGNQSVSAGADSMDRPFPGILDEVRVYERGLSPEDIVELFQWQGTPAPSTQARNPVPPNGALYPQTWVNLSWNPGDFAVTHDLYLGDNFDDVANGTGNTFRGNQTDTSLLLGFPGYPLPGGLVPGTTYYWRVDEINENEPNSPWIGDVWSFSIPPKTAYNPDPADGAEFVDQNAILSWTGGFGAVLHTVYIGDSYEYVDNATGGSSAGSTASYDPGTLEREKVFYWRVDEFDGAETHKGDIWAFTTPGAVGNPDPANSALDVPMNTMLTWTAAENASSHELYFGTDADSIENATTASPEYVGPRALGDESYDPGGLAWDSSYAWRVDEVYPTGIVKGLVWTFDTADFVIVDDFESYDDIDPLAGDPGVNRIFDKWIDGFGTTTNGALVGNDMPPYAEQTIVHGGTQSMIYRYDNAGKTSEATLTLVWPRDWTIEGVTKLSLWVRGGSSNAVDRIYVALSDTAVVYHGDPAATQIAGWSEWVIELAGFGVELTNVNTITLGVGTKNAPSPGGGQGTMYFDDIRLYR